MNAAGAWCDQIGGLAGAQAIGLVPKCRTAFTFGAPNGLEMDGLPMVIDADEQFYFKPEGPQFLASLAEETPMEPHDVRPEEIDVALAIERIEAATTLEIRSVGTTWAGLRSFVSDKPPGGRHGSRPGGLLLAGRPGRFRHHDLTSAVSRRVRSHHWRSVLRRVGLARPRRRRAQPRQVPGRYVMTVPPYSALASHWRLERGITFLNHGSFGACPIDVLAAQQGWQRLMEDQPVAFLQRELEPLMDDARVALGEFVGADSVDLGFVPNWSQRCGALAPVRGGRRDPHHRPRLQRLQERPGVGRVRDEASVVVASVPFVGATADSIFYAVVAGVTNRTRLALVDHVTSPTAIIFPIERLVAHLQEKRGVDVLVDGAHAPGMLPVDIETAVESR